MKQVIDIYRLALRDWCNQTAGAPGGLNPGLSTVMGNLANTLCMRRSILPWKATFVARDTAGLTKILNIPQKPLRPFSGDEIILGFTSAGQGTQWARENHDLRLWCYLLIQIGMGLSLLHYPCFRNTLRKADLFLMSLGCHCSLM